VLHLESLESRWLLTSYYVNILDDIDFADNEYTTAAGLDSNDGLSPATPRATLQSVLNSYNLEPGDVVYVDTGRYVSSSQVTLVAEDSGVTIRGPVQEGHVAELSRDMAVSGQAVLRVDRASQVTVEYLAFSGGGYGLYLNQTSGNSGNVVRYNDIVGNSVGIWGPGFPAVEIYGNRILGNDEGVVSVYSLIDNEIFDNGIGVRTAVEVRENRIYGNRIGLQLENPGLVESNRIFGNEQGLVVTYGGEIVDNRVYGNGIGVSVRRTNSSATLSLHNNVLYDNTTTAIHLHEPRQARERIANNTIVHRGSEAILFSTTGQTDLRNNIFVLDDQAVAYRGNGPEAPSQADYNLYRLQGSSAIADWNHFRFTDLDDWYAATGVDSHSSQTDSLQFAVPGGPDGIQGVSQEGWDLPVYYDNSSDAFSTISGTWSAVSDASAVDEAYLASTHDGTPAEVEWRVTGLIPGATYLLSTTWPSGLQPPSREFRVFSGAKWIGTNTLLPSDLPDDLVEGGVAWKHLTRVTVDGFELTVRARQKVIGPSWSMPIDALRVLRVPGDTGADDDFSFADPSLVVDRGEFHLPAYTEQQPNGNRVDLGVHGDWSNSQTSPTPSVSLEPLTTTRYQVGDVVPLRWSTEGFVSEVTAGAINAGGPQLGIWSDDFLVRIGEQRFHHEVPDLSQLEAEVPVEIFRTYVTNTFNTPLEYHLRAAPGEYQVRLYFLEVNSSAQVGTRRFNIVLQDEIVETDLDIVAEAGGAGVAIAKQYATTVGEDGQLSLSLQSTSSLPILSGIEVIADTAVTDSAIHLQYSLDDGQTWSLLAEDVPLDRFGRGAYDWAIEASHVTSNPTVRVRIAGETAAVETPALWTLPDTAHYYVNAADDVELSDNEYTTVPGDLNHSGITPDQPLPSLARLLRDFTFDPGDVIYVDAGSYVVPYEIELDGAHHGITLQGPIDSRHSASFYSHDTDWAFPMFHVTTASDVTFRDLTFLDSHTAIQIGDDASGVRITSSRFESNEFGLMSSGTETIVEHSQFERNLRAVLVESNETEIYESRFIGNDIGIFTDGGQVVARNNTLHNNITALAATGVIANNIASGNVYGLIGQGTISDNLFFGNQIGLLLAGDASIAANNRIVANNVGVRFSEGTLTNNRIYSNRAAIAYGTLVSGIISHNVIWDNSEFGLVTLDYNVDDLLFQQNTLQQTGGVAFQINRQFASGTHTDLRLKNNIIEVIGGVVFSAKTAFTSDYNQFSLRDGATMGTYLDTPVASFEEWRRQTGFDGNSFAADPQFVDPDGADDELGFSFTSTGQPPVVIDDRSESFSIVGDGWTVVDQSGGVDDRYWVGISKSDPDIARWTLDDLIPGEPIQLFATWPDNDVPQLEAIFTVYEAGQRIRTIAVNQNVEPVDLLSHGTAWDALGIFVPQGTQLVVEVTAPGFRQMIADAILVRRLGADHGQDDDFHLQPGAPGIDRSDPETWVQREPEPNGNRANLGAYGSTAEATMSSPVTLRFMEPSWNKRYRTGDTIPLVWETFGITEQMPVRRINFGGPTIGAWLQDQVTLDRFSELTAQVPIATHLLSREVPQEVLQSAAWSGSDLDFHAPLPPGQYSVTMYFVELRANARPGEYVSDIWLQGEVVAERLDVVRYTGRSAVAMQRQYDITITDDNGLNIRVTSVGSQWESNIAGLEITRLNPLASPGIPSHVEVSFDEGNSWTTVLDDVSTDDLGLVRTSWGLDNMSITDRVEARLRVIAGEQVFPASAPFTILPYSDTFYVNAPLDANLSDNEYTTVAGSLDHTGLTADQPLSSIHDVLALYSMRPGDRIHVDTGVYDIGNTMVLGESASGITIVGPTGNGQATLRTRTPFEGVIMEIAGADDVAISHLAFVDGSDGIRVRATRDSRNIVISDNTFDINTYGIRIYEGNRDIEIRNNTFTNHSFVGVESRGMGVAIVGNEFRGGNRGVVVMGDTESIVRQNKISGTRFWAVESSGDVTENEIFDNADGIQSSGRVEGNTLFRNRTAIRLLAQGQARDNRIYKNSSGIDAGNLSIIEGNRIYSNGTGVTLGPSATSALVESNVIYGNTSSAVTVSGLTKPAVLRNNTIYQSSTYAIYIESTTRLVVENNIVSSTIGGVYRIQNSSVEAFEMDYNLYDLPATNERPIALYLNQARGSLSDWQAVSNQDSHSIVGDPLYVDVDGLDGRLGYNSSLARDFGSDDNFMVSARSPAIDTAKSLTAPRVDILGRLRRDDSGSVGAVQAAYQIAIEDRSLFRATGMPQGWRASSESWLLPLGFEFPYYDQVYSEVRVSVRGFLQLEGSADTAVLPDNSPNALRSSVRIAPMWDNISTFSPGDDIFVEASTLGEITIRWNATYVSIGRDVNFAVTLAQNGDIRFDYGPGNTSVTPTIGISDGASYHGLFVYEGVKELTGAPSITFQRVPGVADIGALEFQGESTDATPPEITGLLPATILEEAKVPSIDELVVEFSEAMNGWEAVQASGYELRSPGPNALYGDADDAVWELAPAATADATQISLAASAGALAPGPYRLTVRAIHDLAGNPLDGDRDGSAGGEFVHEFQVYAAGDLDFSGVIDGTDIDLLAARIRQGEAGPDADLNGDAQLNFTDHVYLIEQILGTRLGDANLDGRVDATDFAAWNENRFGAQTGWSSGDFNGDGVTDVGDFQLWNRHKFQDQLAAAAVARRVPRAASPDVTGRDAWFSMIDSMAIKNRHRRAPFGVR
jgi:parallel beta-helix repeat protein